MGVFQNNLLAGAAAAATAGGGAFYSHQIEQSCRFDEADSSRLYRTFGTPSDGTKMTMSWWMKLVEAEVDGYQQIFSRGGGYAGGGAAVAMSDGGGGLTADSMTAYGFDGSGGGSTGANNNGANTLKDVNGWYHIHWKFDTSKSGMSGNNAKVVQHINGTNVVFTQTNEPSGTFNRFNDNGSVHNIGNGSSGNQRSIYLAEFIFLDGQYEDYTSFGETKNGVWIPKDPSSLTFGDNGFHLKFENSADLGNDSSGNNNDFTATGLGADHQVLDSPTFGS